MKINPLDHIKIASPCSADWNEMFGDSRKRFCPECRLNVYNLSEMTQAEAEKILFETEGRLCVRLYKRSDGTVITQDCPVGWQAIKQRVSRFATAAFGLLIGFGGGIYGLSLKSFDNSKLLEDVAVKSEAPKETKQIITEGKVNNVDESKITKKGEPIDFAIYGGVSNMDEILRFFSERYPK